MIVPTHSPEEVVREAFRDLPALWNKMKDPIGRLKHQVRKKKGKLKLKEPQLFEYRSAAGNNWIVAIQPTKKMLAVVPFVWYRGSDERYRAARIVEDGVSYHISYHVLEQYNNRFNRTGDGLLRLKEFIRENLNFAAEHCPANSEVRVGIPQGYITGCWLVPHQVAQLTTFVDHGRLHADQLEQMDRLDEQRARSLRPVRIPGSDWNPWTPLRPSI